MIHKAYDVHNIPSYCANYTVISANGLYCYAITPIIDQELSDHLSNWMISADVIYEETIEAEINRYLLQQLIEKTNRSLRGLTNDCMSDRVKKSIKKVHNSLNDLLPRIINE